MTVRTVLKEYGSALYVAFALGACAGGAADNLLPTGSEESTQGLDEPEAAESELVRSQCKADSECPAPGAPCRLCSDGSSACPSAQCIAHRCVASFPQCPPEDPCALVRCAAGTTCVAGQCLPGELVTCGGFAGIPCPGVGVCVDDPRDRCRPRTGGADCGGLCTCVQNLACTIGTRFDASPGVCACVSDKRMPILSAG